MNILITIVIYYKIKLYRECRMILQVLLPHGHSERTLVARLPSLLIKNPERSLMPLLQKSMRAIIKKENATIPVIPVRWSDLYTAFIFYLLYEMRTGRITE